MLSRPKASANLFNTSSFQLNAAIFIRFQMEKVCFDGRYRLRALKTARFSKREKIGRYADSRFFFRVTSKLARYVLLKRHPWRSDALACRDCLRICSPL